MVSRLDRVTPYSRSISKTASWALLALVVSLAAPGCISRTAEDGAPGAPGESESSGSSDRYRTGRATRDGIGKFYMGREISHVMGHLGSAWLEREEREREELPDQVVENMKLRPTDVVADIGAGTGYFTFRMAAKVPDGKVLAVDIQPEMLARLQQRIDAEGWSQVEPVRGTEDDPNLPAESVDVALMVDAYHEFSYPYEMMSALVAALKPGGRVVFVEYRGEDESIPIKPLHKMTQEQLKKEMRAVGLEWVETLDFLPSQHFAVFRKTA